MDLVIVHLRYVWMNFNWIKKIAPQKRGWTKIPMGSVFVGVFTYIEKICIWMFIRNDLE